MKTEKMFILSNGRVAAINKKNGEIIWEVKLKPILGTSMGYTIGQIHVEGDKLYIGISGTIACLNAKDGSLVWKNLLKGWGYGFVSLSNANNSDMANAVASINASAALVAATV
jgi:outer membrane protein assembly factor BamB